MSSLGDIGGPLENRLRSLILNNNTDGPEPASPSNISMDRDARLGDESRLNQISEQPHLTLRDLISAHQGLMNHDKTVITHIQAFGVVVMTTHIRNRKDTITTSAILGTIITTITTIITIILIIVDAIPSHGVNVVPADSFAHRQPGNARGGMYGHRGYRQYVVRPEELATQHELLEGLCRTVVQQAEIEHREIVEKENFRVQVEQICRAAVSQYENTVNNASWFQPESVQLKCFGSLASGFATKAADMDLGLLSPESAASPDGPDSPIPRLIEKALLGAGFGARLLTRTRIPIIKLCQKPTDQLWRDLVEERIKWERGITDDEVADDDDDAGVDGNEAQEVASPEVINAALADENTQVNISAQSPTPQNVRPSSGKSYSQRLASLRQSEHQSLTAYHAVAKRTLRRINGRDVTHSNISGFTDEDFQLLTDISKAFVAGLYDQKLKSRVLAYASFSPDLLLPDHKSLQGVFNMIEGERLIMQWETRAIPENHPRTEEASARTILAWSELQRRRTFGTDPLTFNKEMHMVLEQLRRIPSVQLMELKQEQYEQPVDYYTRTAKIMGQLSAAAFALSESGVPPPAISYYISGIYDEELRHQVEAFASTTHNQSLRIVARRHISLHLAAEYARAIELGGLYSDTDVPTIREYINILRQDLVQTQAQDTLDYKLAIPDDLFPVFRRIQELPDPSRLAPNQPKDRYHDRLEFPQDTVGVQCDINFSAHLALQNSLLLRCYAATDSRVRPMVLFVKHWAKARGINTPYRGTLSSYGYVLMVLHYLVNIAQPFVCPNLQLLAPPDPDLPAEALEGITVCKGHDVRFWRDEPKIQQLAQEGVLNQNRDSIGILLRGFFEYYAQNNVMSTIQMRGFDWGRDVLSLRTHGGLLTKQEKNWISARTTVQLQTGASPTPAALGSPGTPGSASQTKTAPDQPASLSANLKPNDQIAKHGELKEVRHRFLFAIEDPFEHDHNVARTVTHNGIVSIRDEFRRAWRIIKTVGKPHVPQENLLENVKVHTEILEREHFANLLKEIHGYEVHVG
ncbi:hypothetical protein BX600DRAFT_543879 [Xylariales sp. PMI_506]|nr:hypothetical protein BX600DRAFT_543879 [Xylariales sp. PMI_506]